MFFIQKRCTVSVLVFLCFAVSSAFAVPLRYHPKVNQKFAYEYKVETKLSRRTEVHRGIVWYETTSVGKNLVFGIKGSLNSLPRSPLRRTVEEPYRTSNLYFMHSGRHSSINRNGNGSELTITPLGKTLIRPKGRGMPCLYFNLASFPFEPLSGKDQDSWVRSGDRLVSTNLWNSLISMSSFYEGGVRHKILMTKETVSFRLQKAEGDLLVFSKKYEIDFPKLKTEMTIRGQGTWTFNQKLGIPESLDFTYEVNKKDGEIQSSFPIKVTYFRLTDEQIASIDKARKERLQASEKKQEEDRLQSRLRMEYQKKQTEEKLAKLRAPFTAQERQEILGDLRSGDERLQAKALAVIDRKLDLQPDEEIGRAIEPLLTQKSRIEKPRGIQTLRSKAMGVLFKISPKYKNKVMLQQAYGISWRRAIKDEQLGPEPEANVELPTGLIVAAQSYRGGLWHPAKIVKREADGKYLVKYLKSRQEKTLERSAVRLAPPEVEQDDVDQKTLAKLYENAKLTKTADADKGSTDRGFRTWTDDTGRFSVNAKYLKTEGEFVFLSRENGKEVKIPFSRLSEKDRQIVKRLKKASVSKDSPSGNPFE